MDETRIHTPTSEWIGRDLRRFEDPRLITGAGQFVDDVFIADCLHLHFVRSNRAFGRIRAIETAGAAASPGIVAVFTGQDLAGLGDIQVNPIFPNARLPKSAIMACEEPAAVGQPVAAVVGKSSEDARSAAEKVGVEVELTQTDFRTEVFRRRWIHGDITAAFARAEHVVSVRYAHARVVPAAIEPRATLAQFDDESETLTVWLGTQTPHRSRSDLARILRLPIEQIRVIAPDVGGTFGGKASIYPEDIVVCWAALRLRRSVKWCAERSEDFLAASHGRGGYIEGELGLTGKGQILGLRAKLSFPLGHWLPYSGMVPSWNASRILPGPYKVGAVDIETTGATERKAAVGIYRGAGRPEAAMLMERLVEQAARILEIDPNQLRRRNLIKTGEFPYRTPTGETFDSGDYESLLDHACNRATYLELLNDRNRRREHGEVCGVGTAMYVEPCGQGWESASIKITSAGKIIAATGSTNQGQGHETAFAQIVADALAIDPAHVTIHHGDTALTPPGVGALASRSTAIGGSALLLAAETFLEKARIIAAQLLQAPLENTELSYGGFRLRGSIAIVSWPAIAAAACAEKSQSHGDFAMETSTVFHAKGEAWSSGCCIATVTIDRETGVPHVKKIVCVDDAGNIINPMLARGQLFGGLAQGLGEALLERIVYDENGELLTGSLSDYALPRAADMPEIILDKLETSSPLNELGAKGVGEAGCIGAPAAIVNAVLDALSPLGVSAIEMPLTGEKIWTAMQRATDPPLDDPKPQPLIVTKPRRRST